MFVQLWNSFSEELKTTKLEIIYKNVTEDLFVKKKKRYRVIDITIAKSAGNHFVYTTYNTNKFKNSS